MVEPWGTLAAGTVSHGMPVISSARRCPGAQLHVLLLLPPIHACTSSMYSAGLERKEHEVEDGGGSGGHDTWYGTCSVTRRSVTRDRPIILQLQPAPESNPSTEYEIPYTLPIRYFKLLLLCRYDTSSARIAVLGTFAMDTYQKPLENVDAALNRLNATLASYKISSTTKSAITATKSPAPPPVSANGSRANGHTHSSSASQCVPASKHFQQSNGHSQSTQRPHEPTPPGGEVNGASARLSDELPRPDLLWQEALNLRFCDRSNQRTMMQGPAFPRVRNSLGCYTKQHSVS